MAERKIENLKLCGTYSIQELFEIIRYENFEAGTPHLIRNKAGYVIIFPEINRKNQVQIIEVDEGKFLVKRARKMDDICRLSKDIASRVTKEGTSMFRRGKKRCKWLVLQTTKQINLMRI